MHLHNHVELICLRTQSHAMGPFNGNASEEARAFTIAAFLIGAGKLR
jgi:hypothetical protein